MTDAIRVEITPERIELEPGAPPVEITISIQNLGDVVEQYTVEVSGLEPDWYTAPVSSVGLFPQDRDQVRITIHPPQRPGIKPGAYPFRVMVRSRSGAQQAAAEATLDLRGTASFQVNLMPLRLTTRGTGTFRVQLSNTGAVDVQLGLEASDEDGALIFRFPRGDAPVVRAGTRAELPLEVRPRQRPWVGPDRTYPFTLTVRPLDARGDPQTVRAEIVHHPWIYSLEPLRRRAVPLTIMLLVLLGGGVFVASPAPRAVGGGAGNAAAELRRAVACTPGIGALVRGGRPCPPPPPRCDYVLGFREFVELQPRLVGSCMSKAAYDLWGNARQYTTNGVLFWQRASNNVFFFKDQCVYAYIGGRTQVVDGPEHCTTEIR